jgi:autophagy-related protein 5
VQQQLYIEYDNMSIYVAGSDGLLPWNITVHFHKFPEDEVLHCHSKEVVEAHFMATIKEADTLKHRSQVINGMQKNEHRQLWTGLQNDKFDQFWAVNRKLMEHTSGEDLFRHIPFRIHRRGRPMTQKLFRPLSDDGQLHVLRDLLEQFAADALDSEDNAATHRALIQGITIPLDATVQWLSEHFSHPDNFLYITVIPK